jgi:hypothetical protein
MSTFARAGATALVGGPLLGLIGVLLQPTLSDDAGDVMSALSAHHNAMIAGLALQAVAIAVLIGGIVWLTVRLHTHAPRLAITGGILAVAGGLVILFEDGVSAVTPSLVSSLDAQSATAAIHQVNGGAAAGLDPLALLFDAGLAVLAFAAVKAGAPRWVAPALTISAFAQGFGFAAASRPVVAIAFAVMTVLLGVLARGTAARQASEPFERAVAHA